MTATAREKLVLAAFELFDEQGYENTTVDQIAERAGVGRTTYFRNFPSKEDVIFPDHAAILDAISGRLATGTVASADVAVAEAAGIVLAHYLAEGSIARSRYALTSTVSPLRSREIASIQQYQKLFGRFIHQWLGGTPDVELRAELTANAVVTAHNYVLRRWLRGETVDPETLLAAALADVVALFSDRDTADESTVSAIVVVRTDQDLTELAAQLQRPN